MPGLQIPREDLELTLPRPPPSPKSLSRRGPTPPTFSFAVCSPTQRPIGQAAPRTKPTLRCSLDGTGLCPKLQSVSRVSTSGASAAAPARRPLLALLLLAFAPRAPRRTLSASSREACPPSVPPSPRDAGLPPSSSPMILVTQSDPLNSHGTAAGPRGAPLPLVTLSPAPDSRPGTPSFPLSLPHGDVQRSGRSAEPVFQRDHRVPRRGTRLIRSPTYVLATLDKASSGSDARPPK